MICPTCGNENANTAVVCANCNAALGATGVRGASEINIKDLLFNLDGRIPRSTYWLKFYLPVFVISIVLSLIDALVGTGILVPIFTLIIIYPSFVVAFKRCHDRGRSAWFLLVLFVPILSLWPAIELGFLKGTDGPNAYGSDPLAS